MIKSGRLILDLNKIVNMRSGSFFDHNWYQKSLWLIGPEIYNFSLEKMWILSKLYLVDRRTIEKPRSTQYLKLERGAHQGDPNSAFLFHLAPKLLFLLIKENPPINDLNISDHDYLYLAYAGDKTFFEKKFIP